MSDHGDRIRESLSTGGQGILSSSCFLGMALDNDRLSTKEEKERCSGSYCQAIGFLVIKDDSISERPG